MYYYYACIMLLYVCALAYKLMYIHYMLTVF